MALFQLHVTVLLFAVLLGAREGNGRSTGAPADACSTITPGHTGTSSGTLPGGYYLYSDLIDSGGAYTSGTVYTIRLEGSNQFKGFLIQARSSGTTTPIGSFNTPSGTEHLSCSGVATATVTHSSSALKSSVTFQWTAPSGTGTVKFQYAVVQAFSNYYANIDSSVFRPPVPAASSATIPSSTMPTTPMETPTAPPAPICPTTDKTANSNFPLTFEQPAGCSRQSCDIYVAMAPNTMNSNYLDIYMEGTAAGWVAVGFSNSRAMENTDVIGCRVDSGSTVSVVDTWNPSPNYSPNQMDDTQDGVCTHSASFTNGRIRCLFSRYGPALNPGKDLDWNTDRYVIYGLRTNDNGGADSLLRHSQTPVRTSEFINAFNASGTVQSSDYPDKALLQIHGILMLISWPVLASIAIFFASWMKPALPNGEWFQTHRALLVISLFITVAGFIFAFVALAMNETPGLINFSTNSQIAHFVIGIIVVLFQIANPIIAIFRCKPDSSWRWIFDVLHASFVGVIAVILALTNVGIGLSLFSAKYSPRTSSASLWTFLGFIGLVVILEIVLHVWFTISAFMAPLEDRHKLLPTTFQWCFKAPKVKKQDAGYEETEMKEKGEQENEDSNKRKSPSTDAPIRWVAAAAFFVLCLIIFPVIVMVAIG